MANTIDIGLDRKVYTSPDTVHAKVTISNHTLLKLNSLAVEIQGFEEISFLAGKKDDRFLQTNTFFSKTISLLGVDQPVWTLSPGQHVFPVAFELPHGLPASFQAASSAKVYGVIEYRVKVRAKPTDQVLPTIVTNLLTNGDYGWPKKHKSFLLINQDEDSSGEQNNDEKQQQSQPTVLQKELNICRFCCIPQGSLDASIRLEQDRIRPGHTIYCFLALDTRKSKVEIGGVEMYIETKVKLTSKQPGGQSQVSFELTSPSIKGPPVPPGLEQEVRPMSFVVPKDLPRTFRSKLIRVKHTLVVEFSVPRSCNRKLHLPIKVYGFATPESVSWIQSSGEDFYYASQLTNNIAADDPPPTYYYDDDDETSDED